MWVIRSIRTGSPQRMASPYPSPTLHHYQEMVRGTHPTPMLLDAIGEELVGRALPVINR
jgi:hypothetical protein